MMSQFLYRTIQLDWGVSELDPAQPGFEALQRPPERLALSIRDGRTEREHEKLTSSEPVAAFTRDWFRAANAWLR